MIFEHQKNGSDERKFGIRSNWIVIAEFDTRIEADFAVNGLRSYDIPAILDARPGVLGDAGLAMFSLSTGKRTKFRVLVPGTYQEEASEIVQLFQQKAKDELSEEETSEENWPDDNDDKNDET
jgi:hypothetical protein